MRPYSRAREIASEEIRPHSHAVKAGLMLVRLPLYQFGFMRVYVHGSMLARFALVCPVRGSGYPQIWGFGAMVNIVLASENGLSAILVRRLLRVGSQTPYSVDAVFPVRE
jgi:hypothetical protein